MAPDLEPVFAFNLRRVVGYFVISRPPMGNHLDHSTLENPDYVTTEYLYPHNDNFSF